MKNITNLKQTIISIIITAVLAFAGYYFLLPAINLHSPLFWVYVIINLFILVFSRYLLIAFMDDGDEDEAFTKIGTFIAIGLLIIFVVCAIQGIKMFHAKSYSKIITVDEKASVDKIPSVEGTDYIALMDTSSAEKLGDREIGGLTDVVSQYDVGEYVQINYKGKPMKVAPLCYASFFKWAGNRNEGIPGYVLVDPVKMDAEYVALEKPMKYVPSARFGDDLYRRLQFAYPTFIFENVHMEIDEDGIPYYIASVMEKTIGLFGGRTVKGAVIADPSSGDMKYYDVKDIPEWVDCVYDGDLICTQYNYSARLQNGYWNSIFGQKGCKKTTEDEGVDYGYIAKDGDIWIYTGVTSVNGDSSNLGFLISNERTRETMFIACPGADEISAMGAAQGEVQEKGYTASFPSLINVDGAPTYIMVLKDANGIVKMYACVNVSQYNQVATATKQEDCIKKYKQLISGEISQEEAADATKGTSTEEEQTASTEDFKEKTIKVVRLEKIDKSGNTYLYILDENNNTYSAKYADVLGMLTVKEGDTISIMTDGKRYTYEIKK